MRPPATPVQGEEGEHGKKGRPLEAWDFVVGGTGDTAVEDLVLPERIVPYPLRPILPDHVQASFGIDRSGGVLARQPVPVARVIG